MKYTDNTKGFRRRNIITKLDALLQDILYYKEYIEDIIRYEEDINDDDYIKILLKIKDKNLKKAIKRSKSFCRYETIHKINSEPILRSLHRTFNPISKENDNSKKIKVMNKKLHRFHGDVWIYINEYC